MPEVRPCAYRNARLVGPWRFMLPPEPLAAERPLWLHGTISTIFFQPRAMCRISAQFLSTLNPFTFMGKRIDYFFGPELERNRINGDQIFVRVIAHERHFRCRASAHSSIFWNAITLELRASLLAGNLCFRFLFWFCMVLYHVEISTVLLLPDQHKPL